MGTILTSILYLSALSSFVYGQGLVWEPAPDLSVPRHEVATTLGKDGRIYAIGGWVGPGNLLKSVEAFDEVTQTWIPNALPDLPIPCAGARAVTDSQGRIWLVGGNDGLDTVKVYDPANPSGGWQVQSAKLNVGRTSLSLVILPDDTIYAVGGGNASGALKSVEKYDPDSGQWTLVAELKEAKYLMGCAVDPQGRIYVFGGNNGIVNFATLECYDPVTNRWEQLRNVIAPASGMAAFFLEGKLWNVGGWDTGMLSQTTIYDPASNSWTQNPSVYPNLYEGRVAAGTVISKTGWIYIIGGQNYGGTATSHVARMKVKENIPCAQWRSGPNMSVSRHDAAIVQGKDNQIYAIGGCWAQMGSTTQAYDTVDVFDGVRWSISSDRLPAPRSGARGVVDSAGRIWVMGGGDPTSNTVLSYQPGSSSGWQTSSNSMNVARSGMGVAITADDTIYAFGGANASGYLRSVEKSVRGGPWSQVAPMKDLRYLPGFVYHNGYIYAVGGQHTTVTLSSAERLNLATGQWEQLPPMPEAKSGPSAFVYHDEIYVVGGWNNYMTSSCFVLNPTTLQWRNESKAALYEGFTCGGSGIPYIVGGQRSAGYSSDHFSIVEWVLYETDFSTDPMWITDQPENFHWDSAAQAYHFRGSNTQPEPYAPMNRYYGTELRLGVGSFVVEWDLYLTRLDWSAGIGFGLFDENRQMFGGQSVWVDFSSVDRGRITSLFVFGAEGQEVRSTDGGIVELNKRYSCRIAYDAPTRQVHYEIRIRRTGELVWSVSVTVPGGFTKDLRFLGGTREGVRPPYTGVNPSAVSEGMIDNVRVTAVVNLSLLSPKGGERWISGTTQTIEWSASAPLSQVRLEYSTDNGQAWNPIGVVSNTGKYPWEVASVNSEQCRVRVSNPNDPGQSAMSKAAFTIFVCQRKLLGDLNGDCYTNLVDLAILAEEWLRCGNPLDPACFPYTTDNGLLAHYKLDETSGPVKDEAGNFDGTNNGATPGAIGVNGNAYEFDGANNVIDTIPKPNIPSVITVSMWVYPTKETGGMQIWGSVDNASGGKNGFVANYSSDTEAAIFAYVSGNVDRGGLWTPNNSVPLNTWTLLTFTVDEASQAKIYVNSTLQASATFTAPTNSHDRALMIGKSILSQNLAFQGSIDDVRIYSRALSDIEVQSLYEKDALSTRLLAYYPFNGDTKDYSGNNRDATAYNDYQYVDGVSHEGIHLVGSGHTGLNGGHVILPFIALNEFPAFTLSIWVNYEGSTYVHGDSFIEFGARTDPSGGGKIVSISYENIANTLGFGVGDRDDSAGVSLPFPSDFIGNWYHLVLRADNGTLTAFVNGQLVGTDYYQQLGPMSPVAGIGCHWFNSGGTESNRFIGTIDEVRIYSRALSDAEVKTLYQNP